ncbi:hypothetical protein GBAR_LOCUS19673 [Geodia barretti]|uniref:Uncharacterized protein n=1 Tax=Geodia barretti TaxID=519541 RepID=A0AA35STF4_GEOBA|nr:hypothetical protein GBAR_LOCUS19673 [Geodia barretti]
MSKLFLWSQCTEVPVYRGPSVQRFHCNYNEKH